VIPTPEDSVSEQEGGGVFDVVIVGAGPAGYAAALYGAAAGLSIAKVEK